MLKIPWIKWCMSLWERSYAAKTMHVLMFSYIFVTLIHSYLILIWSYCKVLENLMLKIPLMKRCLFGKFVSAFSMGYFSLDSTFSELGKTFNRECRLLNVCIVAKSMHVLMFSHIFVMLMYSYLILNMELQRGFWEFHVENTFDKVMPLWERSYTESRHYTSWS